MSPSKRARPVPRPLKRENLPAVVRGEEPYRTPKPKPPPETLPAHLEKKWKPMQIIVAQQIAAGHKPSWVANRLRDHLAPRSKEEQRAQIARARVRAWLKSPLFRDLIYEYAMLNLDLELPQVLQGLTRKAKAGRVDAAKLVLELTGRHSDKGEAPPAVIQLNVGHVPRPTAASYMAEEDEEIVDAEVEEA